MTHFRRPKDKIFIRQIQLARGSFRWAAVFNINKQHRSLACHYLNPQRLDINHDLSSGRQSGKLRVRSIGVQSQTITCSNRHRMNKFLLSVGQKNAIIVNSRICFQQAIYALSLIDISFYEYNRRNRQRK